MLHILGSTAFVLRTKGDTPLTMKIVIIDGQGGKMGKTIIEQLKKLFPELTLYAIGTNGLATAAMLKAGADYGATGENPAIINAADADLIIGPIGIVMANSLLGEITPSMALAIGSSKAYKILIPINRCNHFVVGCADASFQDYINLVCKQVQLFFKEQKCASHTSAAKCSGSTAFVPHA